MSASPPPRSASCAPRHPGVVVLAHPECPPEVVAEADFTGSTADMSDYVGKQKPARVVLITECSMADNVSVHYPDVQFVRPCNLCPHMKRITLAEHPHGAGGDAPRGDDRPGGGGGCPPGGRAHAGRAMIPPLPAIMVEPSVRAALLEDLGRAGDLTTDAIVPASARTECALMARQPGVVAGLDFARTRVPTDRSGDRGDRRARRWQPACAGRSDRGDQRAGARHPDSRTDGAEFPVPSVGRRVRNTRHSRCDCRDQGAGGVHTQDHAGIARGAEIRGARRRRIEPPVRAG